jgi:hypothetical protein
MFTERGRYTELGISWKKCAQNRKQFSYSNLPLSTHYQELIYVGQTQRNVEKNRGEGPEKPGIDLRLCPHGSCRQNQMESPKHQSAQRVMNDIKK